MRDAGALRSEPAGHGPLAGASSRPLAADLLALRELQTSLGLEETDLGVVRIGTNAIVEILALDCGLALVDATASRPEIRFGWCQGRAMPQAEIESLVRALERDLQDVRRGRVPSLHYGGASAMSPGVTGAVRALGLQSLLLLGLGSGGRRTGALVLASREPDAFTGEPMILAELLASEMSEHTQRVRREGEHGRGADDADVRRLKARNAELEAQAAVAAAASLSHDAERQIDLTLRKALELTGHRGGAIHLVETNEAGDDLLCVARALGDPDWVDQARQPRWHRGEGLLGRVWERREGAVFGDLKDDQDGFARETLERAGYHRGCAEPLVASGRVFGVLQMFGEETRPYDDAERGIIRAIARQASTAIHNARLLGDLTRHSLELEGEVDRLRGGDARSETERRGLSDLLAAVVATGCRLLMLPPGLDVPGVQPGVVWRRGQPLLELTTPSLRGWQLALKRVIDVVGAVCGLIVLSPVFVWISIRIKLDSRGPILFRQERVGREGGRFRILKFRTMIADAEQRREELRGRSLYSDGKLFKVRDDPRVTRVGRWLRRTSLDELPQLVNVLKGEMSFVGPRPPLPCEVEQYQAHHYARFDVKPGMTGPWQVAGRNDIVDFEEVVRLETAYIRQWSLWEDIAILAATIPAVFRMRGAH